MSREADIWSQDGQITRMELRVMRIGTIRIDLHTDGTAVVSVNTARANRNWLAGALAAAEAGE